MKQEVCYSLELDGVICLMSKILLLLVRNILYRASCMYFLLIKSTATLTQNIKLRSICFRNCIYHKSKYVCRRVSSVTNRHTTREHLMKLLSTEL